MSRTSANAVQRIVDSLPDPAKPIRRCSEQGCRASSRIDPKIILKGEHLADSDKKAVDCVFFLGMPKGVVLILVELKNRHYDIDDLLEKMRNSEADAKSLARKARVNICLTIKSVFARGGHPRVSTAEYVLLERKGRIRLRRCGDNIDTLIASR
jgi:hypothetical protein